MTDLREIEKMQKALKEIKALKVLMPKVEPPRNGLSQNQIFGSGQMNVLLRIGWILKNYNL